MNDTYAVTKVQLTTGVILETKPMHTTDAAHERTRVEEVMCKWNIDPTIRFPHRTGHRILATRHIIQTWTTPITLVPAKRPDPEA